MTGAALAATTLALTVLAVIQAGEGRAAPAAGSAAVAALAAVAFVLAERRATDPMLPLGLLRNRTFVVANGVGSAMNLATLGMLFLLTLFLQSVQDRSALVAGVALLPLFLPLSLLPPVAGRVVGRAGPRRPIVVGLLVAALGFGLLLGLDQTTPYVAVLPALLLWGVGLGTLTPAVVAAALSAVPSERRGLAAGANNTARQAGGAIGIALYGAVAGAPAQVARFLGGLHVMAVVSALLYLAAALAATFVPGRPASAR